MVNPETPESGELTEGGERTRESEIKANVEFWKGLGVEVDEADVRAKIEELPEVEGFDWYIYVPKDAEISDLERKSESMIRVSKNDDDLGNFDQIKQPRSDLEASYAVAARYQQEPDEDTLGDGVEPATEWEKKDDSFMSPTEYMVAMMRWQRQEGTHLDEANQTIFPGSRTQKGKVLVMGYVPDHENVGIYSCHPGYCSAQEEHTGRFIMGVRRVITKDTKV